MAEEPRSADRRLEAALGALAARVAFPDGVDVAAAVAGRLRSERGEATGHATPLRRRTPDRPILRPVFRPAWQKAAVAAAAAALLATGTLVASPGARQAVANFLGLRGIRITIVPSPSPIPSPSLGSGLSLGDPMTLARDPTFGSARVSPATALPLRLPAPKAPAPRQPPCGRARPCHE